MEKKLAQTVADVRRQHPEAEVEVWAEDEHRVGLHPVNRRVWTPADVPPIAQVNCKYQWMWLAGFVCPSRGETYWWIVPFLTHTVFSRILDDFARHFEVGKSKRIVLYQIRLITRKTQISFSPAALQRAKTIFGFFNRI